MNSNVQLFNQKHTHTHLLEFEKGKNIRKRIVFVCECSPLNEYYNIMI